MLPRRDFSAYHQSIAQELRATQDRIRHLIADTHWLTDGEHKEILLRKILRSHIPETVRVGTGFICYSERHSSTQLDILITAKDKPTLFKEGDLTIVTPDTVRAIIEVKTELKSFKKIKAVLKKLADEAEKTRLNGQLDRCWIGLFIFSDQSFRNQEQILQALQEVSRGSLDRVINCVAIGSNIFVRYWEDGRNERDGIVDGPVWHSYTLNELAQAYFLSNVVWHISQNNLRNMQFAWFPIEGGKVGHREFYTSLDGHYTGAFPR